MSANIPTWQERLNCPLNKLGPAQCIEAEVRDLRAALAAKTEGVAMNDRKIADTVNELREIAFQFHSAGQLRERIAGVIVPLLKSAPAMAVEPVACAWGYKGHGRTMRAYWGDRPMHADHFPLGRIVPAAGVGD